jgi:hypothetical protein
VELWEVVAREGIRDLVARYAANIDAGRFAEVLELFLPDAVLEVPDGSGGWRQFQGHETIGGMFRGVTSPEGRSPGAVDPPSYVRHFIATHQIDVRDEHHARGRLYYAVVMAHGLDRWGRFIDEYEADEGRWRFRRRRTTGDGQAT